MAGASEREEASADDGRMDSVSRSRMWMAEEEAGEVERMEER
jgi:hypothetical protein